jgi:hypothetical protein
LVSSGQGGDQHILKSERIINIYETLLAQIRTGQGCGSGSGLEKKPGSKIAEKSNFRSFRGPKWSHEGPRTLALKALRLKMKL